jgi:thiamine biosynthesis lipoprotein
LLAILQISDKGIATSGNYRRFYIENGQRITHTINPATGYPSKHNLLSVTVVADDALTADAYATAFLVSGVDKSLEWINKCPGLNAIFICDEEGDYKMYCTPELESRIIEEFG